MDDDAWVNGNLVLDQNELDSSSIIFDIPHDEGPGTAFSNNLFTYFDPNNEFNKVTATYDYEGAGISPFKLKANDTVFLIPQINLAEGFSGRTELSGPGGGLQIIELNNIFRIRPRYYGEPNAVVEDPYQSNDPVIFNEALSRMAAFGSTRTTTLQGFFSTPGPPVIIPGGSFPDSGIPPSDPFASPPYIIYLPAVAFEGELLAVIKQEGEFYYIWRTSI